ncbi:MAG: spoIIIJ-associated protein [Parcubacteria group bacterium Gr01-1014_33]|nr:MAG: spoIIIJ-associated protein [Parcubacteria group bacterium Gr01-1014_33]
MNMESIKTELRGLLGSMGFSDDIEDIEVHEGGANRVSVRIRNTYAADADPASRVPQTNMLIGERGANLAALEYMLKRILWKKHEDEEKFTLDINDYRMRRLEDLKQNVKNAAKEVRLYKKEVPLRPMSSFERRIVHLLLAEYPDIATESFGVEPERRVVIKPYP